MTFQTKVPDRERVELKPADMHFAFREAYGESPLPQAYERLLLDAIHGDATLFAREDEIELAWSVVDPLLRAWDQDKKQKNPVLHTYAPGSWGPGEADRLMRSDGRSWQLGCSAD